MNTARLFVTTAAAAALAAGGAAAQGTTQQRDAAAEKITVTGCVERADQVVDRANLGTTVDSQTFILIKADGEAASGATAGTSGAAPSGAAGAGAASTAAAKDIGPMYWLSGKHDFNAHVGHKVEVAGTTERPAPGAVGTSGSTNQTGGTQSLVAPQAIAVESIKMVSSTCPR
jgi:hypothetical protein